MKRFDNVTGILVKDGNMILSGKGYNSDSIPLGVGVLINIVCEDIGAVKSDGVLILENCLVGKLEVYDKVYLSGLVENISGCDDKLNISPSSTVGIVEDMLQESENYYAEGYVISGSIEYIEVENSDGVRVLITGSSIGSIKSFGTSYINGRVMTLDGSQTTRSVNI